MATKIQLRRDTANNWFVNNPVLSPGEIGIETDTLKFKIGNGSSWNSITSYANVTPEGLGNSLGDYIPTSEKGSSGGVAELNSNGYLVIPGSDLDLYELTLAIPTITANRTIDFPNSSGTVALVSDITSNSENIGIKTNNLESTVSGIESTTNIDSALETDWRTLKYLIQIRYSNEIHSTEVIVANDGSNLLFSQYGDVYSNTELASITVEKISGIINLKVTPVSGKTPLTARFFRTGIRA